MSKQKPKPLWSLEIGFYPGILFGFRTYEEQEQISHVFYIPFMDICLTTYNY